MLQLDRSQSSGCVTSLNLLAVTIFLSNLDIDRFESGVSRTSSFLWLIVLPLEAIMSAFDLLSSTSAGILHTLRLSIILATLARDSLQAGVRVSIDCLEAVGSCLSAWLLPRCMTRWRLLASVCARVCVGVCVRGGVWMKSGRACWPFSVRIILIYS